MDEWIDAVLTGDDNILSTIPIEILHIIVERYLPSGDILRLCEISHYFDNVICHDDPLWRKLYQRDFPGRPIDTTIADPEDLYYNNYATAYNEAPGKSVTNQLMRAVERGDIRRVKYLLSNISDYKIISDALVLAIKHNNLNIIEAILENYSMATRKEILNTGDSKSEYPLSIAIMEGNKDTNEPLTDIIHYLVENGANIDDDRALQLAMGWSTPEIVRYILSKNPQVNIDEDSGDPLPVAVFNEQYDIAEELLRRGAYIDILSKRTIIELLTNIYKNKTPAQIDQLEREFRYKPYNIRD